MGKFFYFIWTIIKYSIVGLLLAIIFADYVGQANRVSGQSMAPTMHDGDYVIVDKWSKQYDVHDVVVIQVNEQQIVKRIVAKAGDAVEVKDGQLFVNDARVQYTLNTEDFTTPFPRTLVEKGKVFVIGDNFNHSSDSRQYGAFYYSQINGEVKLVVSLEELQIKQLTK